MMCVSRSFVRKVFSSSVLATLLLCAPLQLAAQDTVQDRAAQAAVQGSVLDWFAGFWSDLTALFTSGEVPAPKPGPTGTGEEADGGGCLDPHGGCGG